MTGNPERHQQVAALFDRVSDTYDQVDVTWFQPIADGLVAGLAVGPGERVLDIGCGRGAALVPLARATGPSGSAVGIDLSPAMVRAAQAAVEAAGLDASTAVADAADPGLEPGSFDVVASSLVLFFLADPRAALAAWVDLLTAGGRLGISTFGPQPPGWAAVDEVFAPYLPPELLDARTSGRSGPFDSDLGVEELFTAAGLGDVRTHSTVATARFRDQEHWYRWTWSQGQRLMWESVPEDARPGVRDQAFAILDSLRDADGTVSFRQPVRYTYGVRPR